MSRIAHAQCVTAQCKPHPLITFACISVHTWIEYCSCTVHDIVMKVLILAAGYGTRFTRDLEQHKEKYPHLVGVAKPLLPVAGKPLISHWLDIVKSCDLTRDSDIYVVVCTCSPSLVRLTNSMMSCAAGECVQSGAVSEMGRGIPASQAR